MQAYACRRDQGGQSQNTSLFDSFGVSGSHNDCEPLQKGDPIGDPKYVKAKRAKRSFGTISLGVTMKLTANVRMHWVG